MDGTLRVVPQPMRRQVEDGLRAAIVGGRFAPGEHLSDRALCDLFGASRSVVREAVRLLEAEGLVVLHPNRGPFVADLSAEDAARIYEVRGVLEGLAGECFARRATEAERAELRAVYEDLARRGDGLGRAELLAIKRRFYDVLLAGARNGHAARMLDQILNRNTQLRATSLSEPGRLPWTVRELRRIVEAVERRDPDEAFVACREHVQRARDAALRVLAAREAEPPGEAPPGSSPEARAEPAGSRAGKGPAAGGRAGGRRIARGQRA